MAPVRMNELFLFLKDFLNQLLVICAQVVYTIPILVL